MATYGLTDNGFVIKTLTVVRADLDSAIRAALGQSLTLGDRSVLGVINGIMAERYAELWALAQVVYNSQNPDAAVAAALDALCLLTGTFRPPAAKSVVNETLVGTPSSTVPSGTIIATKSTALPFVTTQDATIAALTAWVTATPYLVGARVTHSGNAYQCIAAGTSGGTGPTGTTNPVAADGGVTWFFLGVGTGAVDVITTSSDFGAIVATAEDLNDIKTPASGLAAALNLLDAVPGRDVATDQELRLLREAELASDGTGTADAIRGALLQIPGVTSVTVFVNNTDATDASGLPPHSVECLVRTPSINATTDQEIIDTIFANIAAGIATYAGATVVTGTAVDSQDVSHTVTFSRPTEIQIYVDITLTYDATLYPSDGDEEVKTAIKNFGAQSADGKDAVAASLGAQAFKVAGVNDVPRSGSLGGCLIQTSPGPTSDTTIAISLRQLAVYDTSRITVHSSAATP